MGHWLASQCPAHQRLPKRASPVGHAAVQVVHWAPPPETLEAVSICDSIYRATPGAPFGSVTLRARSVFPWTGQVNRETHEMTPKNMDPAMSLACFAVKRRAVTGINTLIG